MHLIKDLIRFVYLATVEHVDAKETPKQELLATNHGLWLRQQAIGSGELRETTEVDWTRGGCTHWCKLWNFDSCAKDAAGSLWGMILYHVLVGLRSIRLQRSLKQAKPSIHATFCST